MKLVITMTQMLLTQSTRVLPGPNEAGDNDDANVTHSQHVYIQVQMKLMITMTQKLLTQSTRVHLGPNEADDNDDANVAYTVDTCATRSK
jgi:hypothetical protein